jgi:hypothetical protein
VKLEQWQLVAIIVGTFAAVIALDIFLQYQSDETFRTNFPKLPSARFAKSRVPEMVSQEMNVQQPAAPTFADEDGSSEVS